MKKIYSLCIILIVVLTVLTACENTVVNTTPTNSNVEITQNHSGEEKEAQEDVKQDGNKYTEVRVSSPKDLFLNAKPYTRIILTEGYYNISDIDVSSFQNENVKVEDCYDGYEFIIRNVDHLEICSDKDIMPEIVTEGAHVNVMSFKNCNNVKIEGVVIGHEVEKGSCSGGVVQMENCSNFTINNSHLYGCGTYGIIAHETNHVTVNNSEIYECSYGILDLYESNDFAFHQCILRNNKQYTMFCMDDCNNIAFQDCIITNNKCDYASSLISAYESTNVSFTQCFFENNAYQFFSSKEDDVRLIGCKIKDENFENRYDIDYED